MEIELIKHAAVRASCGMVFLGMCHADCIYQALAVSKAFSGKADDQGFFTNKGRFVDRKEGALIANSNGQVVRKIQLLFSEDLWSKNYSGKFKYDSIKGYY